jgi:cell cycle serine/threonine-protein kinase CDC5/MSD2
MSAQVYAPQIYTRARHGAPSGATLRRQPFTNAAVNYQQSPPKPQDKPKEPPSPPLPRQNSKTTPPSPPRVISDKSGKLQFQRVGFLGEVRTTRSLCSNRQELTGNFQGGFARVYEVKATGGIRLACKVVTKDSLKTKKAKTKVNKLSQPSRSFV